MPSRGASCQGVIVHKASFRDGAVQNPDEAEGIAIWVETDGNGAKWYRVKGEANE